MKIFSPSSRRKKLVLGATGLIIGAIFGFAIFKNDTNMEEILVVKAGDFVQQVSLSGRVVAARNVDLVFSQTGRVSAVYAEAGDQVAAGAILASLENGDVRAEVLQKEAAHEAAEAKLKSLRDGVRPEQIAVTESNVTRAEVALAQARQAVIDSVRNAYTQSDDAVRRRVDQTMSNPRSSKPELNFFVERELETAIEEGRVRMEQLLVSWKNSVDTLTPSSDIAAAVLRVFQQIDAVRTYLDTVAFGVNSLTPTNNLSQTTLDAYRADITTARANVHSAAIALTASDTDFKNAGTDLATEKRRLDLERAGATASSVTEEVANVKAAEADLLNARARYQKTLVVAPFSGVVTRMDAKVGGSASANTADIAMISAETFQIESFVPEINTPLIAIGDEATVTLDAYGAGDLFEARVVSIDPAETIRDGVSTYRARLQFLSRDPRIKSGMSASIVITTERKSGVFAVPKGIIVSRNGTKFVVVKEGESTVEREVITGSDSLLGTIEITSGLKEGDTVVLPVYLK